MDFWRSLAIIAELIRASRYADAWEFIERNKCDLTDGKGCAPINGGAPLNPAPADNTYTGKGGSKRD